ncbi:response regulator [Noviherbaspirillum sp. CPCC 100848]|uniref:histidine kinase n=1 Tax=Noviherbaspirillum album TaxID=3080276 RepID=A0ABU6J3P2_9BURK|nr:response regulator [Noviherbaspirillum sp. CPCC 100848]MEC4717942.1 response regulator [Noviherbaspirillum sp. CPCC 100848]
MMKADTTAPRVLMIDDQSMAEDMIRHMLSDRPDISLNYSPQADNAVNLALAVRPTVVLVDLRMPTVDGLAVTRSLRGHAETRRIPIVLLSSEDDAEIKAQAFADGANDYLVKWPDKRELVARICYHSSAYLAHKQLDEAFESLRQSKEELLLRTQELAQSQAALHQAQKMEAVGQLTGGVAHDFNNVLQVINGNLELLKLLTAGNQPAQNRIAAAAAGVDRGAKLASHLLAFARRQPLQAVVLNAGELLQGMDELLRHSLGDLTSVQTVVADSLWNTTADPGQLENVILNLAINARDAMAGSGTVTLSARNAGPGGHTRECPEHDAGGRYVLIEVTDTGTGMPPEVLERVFEPFYTTKPAGQGTGLGLSMAYGFVKQSGGHIRLQSEVGQGTTVKVFLPCTDDSAVTEEKPAAGPVFGGIESILVVDDEPDVRETTAQLLTNLGYLALQAENADAALRILERGTHVDLVFTDVVMPGRLRSADFAQKARQLLPHLQVLFTSGYSEGILAHGGRVDPSVSLLRKPYTAEALAQKIRTLLRGREEPKPTAVQ